MTNADSRGAEPFGRQTRTASFLQLERVQNSLKWYFWSKGEQVGLGLLSLLQQVWAFQLAPSSAGAGSLLRQSCSGSCDKVWQTFCSLPARLRHRGARGKLFFPVLHFVFLCKALGCQCPLLLPLFYPASPGAKEC